MPTLVITSKDEKKLKAFKEVYKEMESATLDAPSEMIDHLKKKAGISRLMQMVGVKTMDRNLKNEDAEMVDDYNRQNRLLGGGKSNGDLKVPKDKNDMMVAGDYNVTHVQEPSEPKTPQAPQEKKKNPLLQNLLSAALGAGLLGGGVGLGQILNGKKEEVLEHKTPAITKPVEDTDTIGVLEPDRD